MTFAKRFAYQVYYLLFRFESFERGHKAIWRLKAVEATLDFQFREGNNSYVSSVLIPRARAAIRDKRPEASERAHTKNTYKARGPFTPTMKFFIELDCLSRLNCLEWPTGQPKPFPALLDFSIENRTITMTDCGVSINKLTEEIEVPNLRAKAREIVTALEAAGIAHHDMNPTGANLCVSAEGNLSIIDFDAAEINGWAMTDYPLEQWACTVDQIMNICQKSPYVVST